MQRKSSSLEMELGACKLDRGGRGKEAMFNRLARAMGTWSSLVVMLEENVLNRWSVEREAEEVCLVNRCVLPVAF